MTIEEQRREKAINIALDALKTTSRAGEEIFAENLVQYAGVIEDYLRYGLSPLDEEDDADPQPTTPA